MARVTDVRFEHHRTAFGIGEETPRLSWTLEATAAGEAQRAYRLEVVFAPGEVAEETFLGPLVEASGSLLVDWPARPLRSRERARVIVHVWTAIENAAIENAAIGDAAIGDAATAGTGVVETGLLEPANWVAPFVSPSPALEPDEGARPAFLLRGRFEIPDADVVRVRAYSTAHGVYELEVNGRAVSDDILAPGWTSYHHRLRYQTYDLTHLVQPGTNIIGAWLGDGWYRGRLGFNGGLWDNYGSDVALRAQLEVTLADGSVLDVTPDAWRSHAAPVTRAGLYEGEEYDARLALAGWSAEATSDGEWDAAVELHDVGPETRMVAPVGPPVRVTETLRPVEVEHRASGRIRLDFGQNIAGKLRIRVRGARGHRVGLHHAEVLEGDELGTRPLRGAPSIDRYTLAGSGDETWTPRFTFHGFRYAELENWPGELREGDVEALVVHSDMERTGFFASSHPGIDRLHENVVWSMRDNFLDLPTDCPQRDERLGWTGDIQVFGPTASYLYRSTGVLVSWLRDLAAEQKAFGSVPNFVPWIECGFPADPAAAWGDAAVLLPWTLYERTGDIAILADQFESMCAWVDQVDALTGRSGLWNDGFQLGDWLDPTAPPDRPDASRTDRYLVATAYHARSARVLAETAELLGHEEDTQRYRVIADRAAAAFRSEFVTDSGRLVSDTETALSVAIVFDLLETEVQVQHAGARLVELVVDSGYVIRTGFVGTPIICDALARVGAWDTAYHLLLQTASPSWLYPVTMGATTIWERWDSMLPDGSINPGEMTSFNHYSLGAVADYLHRVVAGLAPSSPGYRTMTIAPRPGGGLTSASARLLTPFGHAESAWTRAGEVFELQVTVPPGATALVQLPDGSMPRTVRSGRHRWECGFRDAADDPAPVRRVNLHNPEEREALAEA